MMNIESETEKNCIALIPARGGSKRVKSKNIRLLGEHPLIAYSISAALQSGIFSRVLVSTESREISKIAESYGAEVPFLRPSEFAGDFSPDIEWVADLLKKLENSGFRTDYFSILRPTSPFRLPETITRAWNIILAEPEADSLRAVEKCSQHPAKMWLVDKENNRMKPLLENPDPAATPWHSMPYQSLPEIYVQNASLEISKVSNIFDKKSISGDNIIPFITDEFEGFDINVPYDFQYAEELLKSGKVKVAEVRRLLEQSE